MHTRHHSAVPEHLLNVSPQNGLAPKIQDYGVIGDCRSAALVSKYGSIDWLCWPRFDNSSIFAALLDPEKGGFWSIYPARPCNARQTYVRDSNILQTRFICDGGRATLTDLMPVSSDEFKQQNILPDHEIIREVQCTEGTLDLEIKFQPRANYGKQPFVSVNLAHWACRWLMAGALTGCAAAFH